MKGRVALVAGGLGAGAFWRRLRSRSAARELAADPAAELRAKLAESKAASGAAAPQPPEAPELDPASRRRAIHERARGSIDELG
jgi:hypothetical protein